MATIDQDLVLGSLRRLLAELYDGPSPKGTWIINPGDAGILESFDRLSAEEASARLIPGRSTLAGHANHLRFSLELFNRWSRGENPWADADWAGSWSVQTVTDDEWRALREALRAEAHAWLEASQAPREWDPVTLTGTLGSAAHTAYHLGAIRQLLGLVENAD